MIKWIVEHIKISYILTPFAIRNIKYYESFSYTGYTDFFIFGIRIARIQRTKPWE